MFKIALTISTVIPPSSIDIFLLFLLYSYLLLDNYMEDLCANIKVSSFYDLSILGMLLSD